MGGVVKKITGTIGGLVDQINDKKGGGLPKRAQGTSTTGPKAALAPPPIVDTFTRTRKRNPAKVALAAAKRGNNTNFSNAARVLRG